MKRRYLILIACWCLLFVCFAAAPSHSNAQRKNQSKQAAKLSSEGDRHLRQKDYRAAIVRYAEAIALVPSLAQAHYGKGNAHIQLNENEEAVNELSQALAGGYEPLDVYRLRWRLFFERKNYDAALADARKSLEIEPKNAAFQLAVGEILLAKNDYAAALDNFEKFARSNPNDADVYYFIAAAHLGLKNVEKQIAAAEEAVKRNTKYAGEAHFLIAEAKRADRNYAQAIESYNRAVAAKPNVNAVAYQNLADVYRRRNQFAEAIEITKRGLQAFPDDSILLVDLGRFYNLADRNVEAIAGAEKAVKMLPQNHRAHALLCRIYYETKQLTAAQKSCQSALEINRADGASNVYSGFINLSLGRDEAAKIFFKTAVDQMTEYTRANPDYFDGFYLLGNALYYAEQPARAIDAYLKTLALNPKFTRARFNLGLAYFVNKNLPAARQQHAALAATNKDLADKLLAVINKK